MSDAIRPLIAGNWKMNGLKASATELDAVLAGAGAFAGKADLLVCPPATLLAAFAQKARGKGVAVGAQDCHPDASGAHTGDLSAEMLAKQVSDISFVIHDQNAETHAAAPVLTLRGSRIVNSVNSPTRLSTSIVPPCCWVTMS